MVRYLVILLLIALVVFGVSVYYFINKDKSYINDNNKYSEKENTKESGSLLNSKDDSGFNFSNLSSSGSKTSTKTSGTGGGGSSGGGSSGSDENTTKEKILPSDITQKPCGFYFEGYEVCTGYCPEGTCVSEERSCYCKK
ncbi:MAG: hypothetical protein Q8N99_01640 [Nanoarchaeota archaeon]|nr:hypothetical protein [Nanoarchaeota archaeon]